MEKQAGRILKADDVKMQGSYHLDVSAKGPKPTQSPNRVNTTSTPQVCILEENSEYAIIEITCCCGSKAQVKCEFKNNEINQ